MSKIQHIEDHGRVLELDDGRCKLAVMYGELHINWHGLIVDIGPVESANWKIDPFPNAWRVSFDIGQDRSVWFDVDESQAIEVQRFIEIS